MHATGRMWTLNNSSQDFSVIKEMEVLKRGFPLHAILVKSNSARRQNVTTALVLLNEKTFPLSSPCPAPAHGALNPPALSRSFNTYFMVRSFITDTETHCVSTAQLWGNSSTQLLNMEEEGKANLATNLPSSFKVS